MSTIGMMLKIGGDAKGAVNALKKTSKESRELTDREKKLGMALGAVALATAAAMKMAIDYGDKLNKVSQQLGVTTEAMSGLAYAAKLSGVDFDGLKDGMKDLGKIMHDSMKDPASETSLLFKQMGVALTDTNGDLRSTDLVMADLADTFKLLPDGADKSAVAMKLMGESGMKLIPMLNQGSEGMSAMAQEAEALGVVWSEQDAAAAAEFNDQLTILKTTAMGFVQEATKFWLPVLSDIAGGFILAARSALHLNEAQERTAKSKSDAQDILNEQDTKLTQLQEIADFHRKELQAEADAKGITLAQLDAEFGTLANLDAQVGKVKETYKRLNEELGEQAGILTKAGRALIADAEKRAAAAAKLFNATGKKKHQDQAKAEKKATEDLAAAALAADRAALEALISSWRSEEQVLNERYMAERELIDRTVLDFDEAERLKLEAKTRYMAEMLELTRRGMSEEDALKQASADMELERLAKEEAERRQIQDAHVSIAMNSLSAFAAFSDMVTQGIVAAYGEGSAEAEAAQKALFVVTKGVALAQSIVSTAVAVSNALAMQPPPLGIAMAIAVGIAGATQVATIIGTTIAGLADSGLTLEQMQRVAGSGHSAIMVRGDEMVLDSVGTRHISEMLAMQKAGMSRGRSQGINTTVVLDGEIVGRSVETYMVGQLERGFDYRDRSRTNFFGS